MAWVEARCDRHLWFRLDPDRGLIEVRCGRCGGLHYYDAGTGEAIPSGDRHEIARPHTQQPTSSPG